MNGGSAEGAGFAEGAAAQGECADDTRGQGSDEGSLRATPVKGNAIFAAARA